MSDCREIRTKMLETGAAEGRSVAGHLAACPGCTRWLADLHRADAALTRLPDPQIPAGFESRMQKAIDREAAAISDAPAARGWLAPRFWIPAMAAAAAIVVVVAASLYFNRPRPAAASRELGVALKVTLTSTESIRGADISFSLPSGIDLAGAERSATGRNLAWRQDLAAGRTEFAVGLVAFAPGDHRVAVVVCREGECASGTVVVHAGLGGARMTWIKPAARGPARFALSLGAGREEEDSGKLPISTQEDRS